MADQIKTLVITMASYKITVDSATGEPLDNETVAARQRTEDWSTMKGGKWQDGLAVGANTDEPLYFIRPDGTIEPNNNWDYRLNYHAGCSNFTFTLD
jgi:hypothetical protein